MVAAGLSPRARTRRGRAAAGRCPSYAKRSLHAALAVSCLGAFAPPAAVAETTAYGALAAPASRPDTTAEARDAQEQLGSNRKIVQGSAVTRPKYPWVVAFAYLDGQQLIQFCGGSLVKADTVLTAAHCPIQPGDTVIGGRLVLTATNTGTVARVVSVAPGPYDTETRANDYALVRLDRDMPGKLITLMRDESYETNGGNQLVIAGWGRTSASGPSSTQLLEAPITTVPYTECQGSYQITDARVTSTMFCGSADAGDACQGDSGGPAMRQVPRTEDYELVGLVSWGKDCGQAVYPGVYARASAMACWVERKLAKWDATDAEIARACTAVTPNT